MLLRASPARKARKHWAVLSKMAKSKNQNCQLDIPFKCGFSTRASLRIPDCTDGRESVPASRIMRGQKTIPLLLAFLSMHEEIHEWLTGTLSLPLTVWFTRSSIWHLAALHLPDFLSSECASPFKQNYSTRP